MSRDCEHHRFLLVAESGVQPSPTEHVGVCSDCGLFLVRLMVGKSVVITTFRLNPRQLKAAGKATERIR